MNIRLHEIELGSADVARSNAFYEAVFGRVASVAGAGLAVFSFPETPLDFNTSTHLPAGELVVRFYTDDLDEVMDRLVSLHVRFSPPAPTHLDRVFIGFRDPDGYRLEVHAERCRNA
ncbi:MAG: hypothetical protein JWP27_2197 [Flaviaesturariibacter sp.]|nr:hypothetical protein [Flaviaesturariibacter sp.]